jgi:hypothetical protein
MLVVLCNATFSIYWKKVYSESIETKCEINLVGNSRVSYNSKQKIEAFHFKQKKIVLAEKLLNADRHYTTLLYLKIATH